MKILQVGKFYPIRGGIEKVMYDLTLGLSAEGVHCDMLCATTEGYRGGVIELNSYGRVIAVKTQWKFSATMIAPAMITRLRRIANEYDMIHIHHPDPMASLALFLSGYKRKVILHWHSDILKQKLLLKLYAPLQRWLIKRADLIVGTTPVYVRESPFLKGMLDKIDYIPIGVEAISADKEQVELLRRKYDGYRLIFSLGRLVEYKGYKYLIEALAKLDDTYRLAIGGIGPLRGELEELVDHLGVRSRVEFLGYVSDEDVPKYFEACDLFCLSSIWKTEAFAIVQIEAMSCGKPVVSTHIKGSGVSWVNADQVSGLVVPAEDADALANAIKKLMDDRELYEQVALGGRRRYKELFTRKKMVDKSLSLYRKLLKS
ncbi:glycosyltransferase [Albibacterium indicum]|uniref:glycosyltransferase n=1 Tax=Albibacterium indicum TaxID=2292082 RepID=UPI000E557F84|nr:glycosyltransferase [Pedobacter indicus]